MKKIKVNKTGGDLSPYYAHEAVEAFIDRFGRKPGSVANEESNWGAVQEEREEKNSQLEFFIMACGCGTQTMVELEYAPSESNEPNDENVETFTLDCPGCGFKTNDFNLDCSPDGVTIRIIESWLESKTEPKGLGRNGNLEQEIEDRTRERDELYVELKRGGKRELPKFRDLRVDTYQDSESCSNVVKAEIRVSRTNLMTMDRERLIHHVATELARHLVQKITDTKTQPSFSSGKVQ